MSDSTDRRHIAGMTPSVAREELARLQEVDDRRAGRILAMVVWVFVGLLGVALLAVVSQ